MYFWILWCLGLRIKETVGTKHEKVQVGFRFSSKQYSNHKGLYRIYPRNVRSLCPVLNQFQTLQVSFELAIAPLVKSAVLSMTRKPFVVGTNWSYQMMAQSANHFLGQCRSKTLTFNWTLWWKMMCIWTRLIISESQQNTPRKRKWERNTDLNRPNGGFCTAW